MPTSPGSHDPLAPEAIKQLGLGPKVQHTGTPTSTVRAWLEPDDTAIVRFAASLVLERRAGRLQRARAGSRRFVVWIIYGTLVVSDGVLGVGSLTVGPALRPRDASGEKTFGPAAWYRLEPDASIAVSAAFLRFVSPEQIRADAVAYLRQTDMLLRLAESQKVSGWESLPRPSARERAAWKRFRESRQPGSRTSEAELEAIARLYLALIGEGDSKPLLTIAEEFGLTREQARDRVHRCRDLGFLTKGRDGKATAEAGPRLRSAPPVASKRGATRRAATKGAKR